MTSQICETLGDVLFFSFPFAFQSWQTPTNGKEKMQTVGDAVMLVLKLRGLNTLCLSR
jgi:hypothetical protein